MSQSNDVDGYHVAAAFIILLLMLGAFSLNRDWRDVSQDLTINQLVSHGLVWSIDDQEPPETITEDDPRWDCATMGNKVC